MERYVAGSCPKPCWEEVALPEGVSRKEAAQLLYKQV